MLKSIRFVIIPITVVIAALLIYFFYYKPYVANGNISVQKFIPKSALMAVKTDNLASFTKNLTQFISTGSLDENLDSLKNNIIYLDNILTKNGLSNYINTNSTIYLSLHPIAQENLGVIMFADSVNFSTYEVFNFIKRCNENVNLSKHTYQGFLVYDVIEKKSLKNIVSYTIIENNLIISPISELVEQSINHYKKQMVKVAFPQSQKVCFAVNQLEFTRWLKQHNYDTTTNPFLEPNQLDGYSYYEVKFDEGNILLSKTNNEKKKSKTDTATSLLSIQDKFNNSLIDITQYSIKTNFDYIPTDSQQISFKFFNCLEKGYAQYIFSDTKAKAIHLKNNDPKQSFKLLINGSYIQDSSYKAKFYHYHGKNYMQLKVNETIGKIIPVNTIIQNEVAYALVDSTDVFVTNDENTLKYIIDFYSTSSQVSKKTNYSFLADCNPISFAQLTLTSKSKINYLLSFLTNVEILSYEYYKTPNEAIKTIVLSNHNSNKTESGSKTIQWKYKLPFESPTKLYQSEYNGCYYFFFLFESQLYCINQDGILLFTKKIDGEIFSAPKIIDLYNNKDIQFLFNTRKSIYLIDKVGKDVGNYPFHLGYWCTSEIALMPPSDNNSGSYFVATQNNRIYGFKYNGKPISGWEPNIVDAPLVIPIQKYLHANNKYIYVGVTNRGTLYLLTDNAERRVKPIELKKMFYGSFYLQLNNKAIYDSKLWIFDSTGSIYKVEIRNKNINKLNFLVGKNPKLETLIYNNEISSLLCYGDKGINIIGLKNGQSIYKKKLSVNFITHTLQGDYVLYREKDNNQSISLFDTKSKKEVSYTIKHQGSFLGYTHERNLTIIHQNNGYLLSTSFPIGK